MSMALNKKSKLSLAKIFKEFKPKPQSNVLLFAKKYGMLSAENSSITGRFVPIKYQEDILVDGSNSNIETLVFMKSTRVGYTLMLKFIMAYHIVEDPCPQLCFFPNDNKAIEFSKEEFKPMMRDMPIVGDKIYKGRTENITKSKSYNGGFISFLGAQTPNSYASKTAKKVYGDEYDRAPHSVGDEGTPSALMRKRMESFWDGTLILGSTPTTGSGSKINKEFLQTDMMRRYVPCPECGHMQYLKMDNIVWDKELRQGVYTHLPNTAKLKCLGCNTKIDHKHKRNMDDDGQWRQTKTFFCCDEWQDPTITRNWHKLELDTTPVYQDTKGYSCCKICNEPADYNQESRFSRGYHINALYSFQPNTTWVNVAKMMIEAKNNSDLMRVFKNTWLGEIFEEKHVKISDHKLLSETIVMDKIPQEIEVIIMSVDTQNSWLQYTIRGWCKGETSYGLDQGKIEGDPVNISVWDSLFEIVQKTFEREDGKRMRPYWCFIDSGGQRTDHVRNFVQRPECKGICIAVKGQSWEAKNNDNRPYAQVSQNKALKMLLVLIATNKSKDLIYDRLQLNKGDAGYMYFNKNFDEEYFLQLTCEKKVFVKDKKGYMVQKYEAQRQRNEAIDLECYNLAAIKFLQSEGYIDLRIDNKNMI